MRPEGIRDVAIPVGGVNLDGEPHAFVRGRMPLFGVAGHDARSSDLTNAVRHADARSIVITVTVANAALRRQIRDDGRGFDPLARRAEALGIASMQERATALGALLTIDSKPGGGTTVALEWPAADVGVAHRASCITARLSR